MSIESLRIQGFRSLRDVTWKPGRLNVLIGPNGSGKSNLIEGLEFLRFASNERLRTSILSLGGPKALTWDNQVDSISWELNARAESNALLAYTLELTIRQEHYWVEREVLREGEVVHIDRSEQTLRFLDGFHGRDETRTLGERFSDQESVLDDLTLHSTRAFQMASYLSEWALYHDVRVDRESDIRTAAVARFEKRLARDGQNLIPVLHTLYTGNREFKRDVDSAMQAAFGDDYEELVFPPAADQRVQLRIRWRSLKTEQPAANLSDGTLRFLSLLAILANPEPSPLIAIDEPETGLHPRMFPIIAEFAEEAAEKTQIIFTTHSSQFLDAFKEEPPTTTVAQMVDGETRLSVLDGEELGRWLKEYSLGYLFRSRELEGMA